MPDSVLGLLEWLRKEVQLKLVLAQTCVDLYLRPLDIVGKALCFWAVRPQRSSIRSFVRTDFVSTMCHELLEQSR